MFGEMCQEIGTHLNETLLAHMKDDREYNREVDLVCGQATDKLFERRARHMELVGVSKGDVWREIRRVYYARYAHEKLTEASLRSKLQAVGSFALLNLGRQNSSRACAGELELIADTSGGRLYELADVLALLLRALQENVLTRDQYDCLCALLELGGKDAVANRLGRELKTVRVQLSRARARLKEWLDRIDV